MTLMSNTTSPTSDAITQVNVTYTAKIARTEFDGGAWFLIVASVTGVDVFAFSSYRHAQKHLASVVGKDRIRMVREGDEFTYSWTAPWKK